MQDKQATDYHVQNFGNKHTDETNPCVESGQLLHESIGVSDSFPLSLQRVRKL